MNMRSKSIPACTVLLLISMTQMAVAASLKQDCNLPTGLQEQISSRYPGVHVVTLTDMDEYDRNLYLRDHDSQCPGLAAVDFYGDGKPTLALVLLRDDAKGRRAELVVARKLQNGWEISSLDTAEAAPVPVVWGEKPGKYDDVQGQKTITATKPVIVLCGYESWAILYAWTGKRVEKIWISD